uniref:Caveolae associated protein 2a n=1 Tax=Hucho hucho TaxID=62062 RepID=A0A4W5JWJ5_9TELE
MGEDSSHAECSSNSSSILVNPQQYHAQQDNMDLLVPSFSPSSAPSSPTDTLSRLGLKTPGSSGSPTSPMARDQVSAITVVALLDKLVNMLEAVQENQLRMEQRQADLEGAVQGVQGDVTRLSKNHTSTSNSVSKLLERSHKVNTHMKEVRERLDKQASQVKRLEANHGHLLKRNHFKVLIFQEDNEIPSSMFIKDSPKTRQANANRSQEEGVHNISLYSSDNDTGGLHEDDEDLEGEAELGLEAALPSFERSRADRLKRSSLKKVDSLKKAFSRQSIEKKMTKISTKIVPPTSREKIKKSFTPNHPKSPIAKSSSFKVSPMTFNVKKLRGEGKASPQPRGSPSEQAHVEIPPLGSMDGDLGVEGGEELASPSSPGSMQAELTINGEAGSLECNLTTDPPPGLALLEHDDDMGEEEKVYDEEQESPVEVKTPIPAVEQAS